MAKNGRPHSKPSTLMDESTVKDPPFLDLIHKLRIGEDKIIKETSIRYRCAICGKFLNPAMAEIFREHQHD